MDTHVEGENAIEISGNTAGYGIEKNRKFPDNSIEKPVGRI
jgi:hypothetical protein